MNIILFNSIGIALIVFFIWWFWLSSHKSASSVVDGVITIKVTGGVYLPDTINAKVNQPIELCFTREDPSPCAEAVIFDGLNLSQSLPLNKTQAVKLKVDKAGTYEFTCPMGMYRGKLIITD